MLRKIENIKKSKSLLLSFGGFKSIVAARKVYFHTTDNEIYETLRELYNEEQDNLELEHAKEEYERIKKLYENNELIETEYKNCEIIYTSLKQIMEYKQELKKLKSHN